MKAVLCRVQGMGSAALPRTLDKVSPLLISFVNNMTLSSSSLMIHHDGSIFPKPATFCSSSKNTKVNFYLPSDSEDEPEMPASISKSKLPPPYDPFKKEPLIKHPDDHKNLQEIFYQMRSDGLMDSAIKMFDGLSKDSLTHEALELFSQIKDRGQMPDVVAHTAVIEAYASAGHSKEALKVFIRMLASGVAPNTYTYTVLIKGLAADAKLGEAKKYLMEMIRKGMHPNAGAYTAVFEAFAREQKVEEANQFLVEMKSQGFVADEKAVKEVFGNKRGQVFLSVMDILFDK